MALTVNSFILSASNQSSSSGSAWHHQQTNGPDMVASSTPKQQQQTYTLTRTAGQLAASLLHAHAMNNNNNNNNNNNSNNNNKTQHDNVIDINYHHLNGYTNQRHYASAAEVTDFLHPPLPLPLHRPPYFDFGIPRNITARSGQMAAINCRVEFLGDKSVGRTGDLKNWSLHIKYAQPRDSGIYECQVNTEPKMSMAFRLSVLVTPPDAKAFISGPTDLYVKVGSAVTLMCNVKQPSTPHDIGPIHWYRGPHILTPFVVHPNEAAIDMKRISMESQLGDKLHSRLRITNAQLSDTGNYTCMPTTAEAASVTVNVINDESPAAMQKSNAASNNLLRQPQQSAQIILIILTLVQI